MSDGFVFPPITAQEVQNLEERFLATSRGPIGRRIQTRGLFDFREIIRLQRLVSRPIADVSLVELGDLWHEKVNIQSAEDVALSPPDSAVHYVYRRVEQKRFSVDAIRLKNVLLSFDVRNNGRIQFYCFSEDRKLINGLFFGATPFVDDPIKWVDEPSVLIDDFFPKPNICHFLFDKFPRAKLVHSHFGCRTPVLFHEFPYADEVFSLENKRLISLAQGKIRKGTVFFEDLVLSTDSMTGLAHPAQIGSPAHCDALMQLRKRIPLGKGNRRVMIKRAPDLPRNIENSDVVEELLVRYGFELLDPANMSVTEQIKLFSETDVLIGVHGAGLANLCFLPRNSTVVELMPPLCATTAYWVMAGALGLNYRGVVCLDPELGEIDQSNIVHNPSHNRRNVLVPVDLLERELMNLPAISRSVV